MSESVRTADVNATLFTNITSTFTGIGYVIIDVNGLVADAMRQYGLNIRQMPLQTVLAHFRYIEQNLRMSGLKDLRFFYEFTGNLWEDYLVASLNDGRFVGFSEFSRTVEDSRIALLMTSTDRVGLIEHCHFVGIYVGMFDKLVFVHPYAQTDVLKPSETLTSGLVYSSPTDTPNFPLPTQTTAEVYLDRLGYSVDTLNAEFWDEEKEYAYEHSDDCAEEDVVRLFLERNSTGDKIYFDWRIAYKLRSISNTPEKSINRSIYDVAPEMPWGGKDLDLIIPVIPERPNMKHLANIRRSAQSMYDRSFRYATVPDSRKGSEQPKKVSVKMQKIMEENAERIRLEKEKTANSWLRGFFSNYTKLTSLAAKKSHIESIKMDNDYIMNKLSLLKVELYMDIWRLEQRGKSVDEKVLVPLYLQCLSFIENNCVVNTQAPSSAKSKVPSKEIPKVYNATEVQFVLTKLVEAGFEATAHEICLRYGIDEKDLPYKTKATDAPNDIDLYFQLKYAGDHLKRTLGTRKDSRVPFDPDAWQAELLDVVDAGMSAVVSAPTSCGKTFICFYAIEKILKSSDTDIVVFCLPTKALANQVSADIYARFTPKNCRMVLQGTLMADRCSEPFNCQVLITIPCMLESLLASRSCENIKYIIIDEVHKINDEAIGLSIERIIHQATAPMLLLSATIGNLQDFFGWFSAIEHAKGRKCALVTHSERFCELKPYVYRADPLSISDKEEDASTNLLPLNCMFPYSFSHLKEFGFGDDICFLPEELLNLYYYIYLVLEADQKRLIKKLAPKKFFKSNIITKADVREYQRHLLHTFESWVQEGVLQETQTKEVYNYLVGQTINAFPLVSTEAYLVSNILNLLNDLKNQEMLPVIIFNMDRDFVTRLAKAVYLELESMDMRKKKDKLSEKLKKEQKRQRDVEKTKDSWIEESIASEIATEPETRDIKYTFLDKSTRLSDAEVREELADVRGTPKFITDMVYRGIGIHHAAIERRYRAAVEILFRKKHVRVLFATETLALGINMPCRTVVFAGDSLALDPMNYKQMAGRAGRRGFDTLGNVVFLGVPQARVQNLMVSMLPQIQGSYTFSNTSLISFKIEDSIIKNPLLGAGNGSGSGDLNITEKLNKLCTKEKASRHSAGTGEYTFSVLDAESGRRELVEYQKSIYPFIYPANYLWDLFISNRCEDPAIFVFALLFHQNLIPWDQNGFMKTIAHLFEVRSAIPGAVLDQLPENINGVLQQVNALYLEDLRHFYTPQLRTLCALKKRPLHYIRSFLYYDDRPKNSYICDFFSHGSSSRIAIRNKIPEGELWQSLYNIDYLLSSFMKMIETVHGADDDRLRKLSAFYTLFHKKFKCIFA